MPNDFTPEELELYEYLVNGFEPSFDVKKVYKCLDDHLDMFIVCYVYEAGNTQKSLEAILGLSKMQIYTRIKKIKAKLYKHYKNIHLV